MKTKLNRWLLCCAMWLLVASALPVHAFYNPSTGRWLSRDPIGTRGGVALYVICNNNTINDKDMDGRIKVTTLTKGPYNSNCGDFEIRFDFSLDNDAKEDGYIVQEITYVRKYTPWKATKMVDATTVYYEAWFVKAGTRDDTSRKKYGQTDLSREGPLPGAHGTISHIGKIKFFYARNTGNLGDPGATPTTEPDAATGLFGPSKVHSGHVWMSGDLPSINAPAPAWWNNASDGGETDASRSVSTDFTCSCTTRGVANPGQKNQLLVSP